MLNNHYLRFKPWNKPTPTKSIAKVVSVHHGQPELILRKGITKLKETTNTNLYITFLKVKYWLIRLVSFFMLNKITIIFGWPKGPAQDLKENNKTYPRFK